MLLLLIYVFTALHCMQRGLYSDRSAIRPSLRLSLACIVTKRM